jgi:AmiR/NasT family two-component response regulator
MLLATHGAQAASAALNRRRAEDLERGLRTHGRIGMAMGILMARHKVTDKQALDLLRIASQNSNRKVADVAEDVIDTGVLDVTVARRRP